MNKTAKEWIASVKDPVIKRYLEENVSDFIIDGEFPTFCNFIDGCFYSPETKQGDDFWYYVSQNNPSTLSYSDFNHLDKSVEQPKVSVNEDAWISSEPPKDGTKILRWHKLWQCPIAVKANNLEDSRLTFPWVECSLSTAWPEDSFVKDKWMPLPPPPNYTKTT
jgi:hypothetical protein